MGPSYQHWGCDRIQTAMCSSVFKVGFTSSLGSVSYSAILPFLSVQVNCMLRNLAQEQCN